MLRKGITILLLCLIGFLIANKAIFTHVHKENGVMIVHSHPFDKSADSNPIKKHNHTKAQLFITHHLKVIFTMVIIIAAILLKAIEFFRPVKSEKLEAPLAIFYSSLRAPPAC